jgi:DNA polymerase-3 subunit epsilon
MIMASKNAVPSRVICLDTETTGLKPDADRIVQLACVELLDGRAFGRKASWLFNPGIPIPEDATRVHGIRDQDVLDKPPFKDIASEFLDLIGNDPLVIHNAAFDVGFLNAEMERAGFPPLANTIIDTLPMVRAKAGAGRATLDAACRMFDISLERRKVRHDALIDAELLAEVYGHLVGARRRTLFDLPLPEAARRGGGKKHDERMMDNRLTSRDEATLAAMIPDRGLGGPSQEERASHRTWRQGFGLAGLCLILALGACSGRQVSQDASEPASAQSDARVAIVDDAKIITAEDRVLVDPRQGADRRNETARTSAIVPSAQPERSAQTSGPSPTVPPSSAQDVVDARTLAILATLLGSQPPPSPTLGPPGGVPTGTSPMLRLIQP